MALVASVVSGASDAGAYPTGGALSSVQVLTIDIAGKYGVPLDAVGVAMNVTVASASAGGFLTVFPCGRAVPNASNVNYRADQTVPNFVMSALANDGTVCISRVCDD